MEPHLEAIVRAYVEQAGGDREKALRDAVSDALADLLEAERRTFQAERLISKGYARGRIPMSAPPHEDNSVTPREEA
jgi:hypothetical protein